MPTSIPPCHPFFIAWRIGKHIVWPARGGYHAGPDQGRE